MTFSVPIGEARSICAGAVTAAVEAVDGLSEYQLLAGSRCHGWSRLDVVVHLIGGWQEMLMGMVSPVEEPPTVDAATYWTAFADEYATDDPLPPLMMQRRRTAAYARPASAVAELHDVADAVRRGVGSLPERRCQWQGQVFEPGDFLAVWAVEDVVHQLDLDTDAPAPPDALALARGTVEALLGDALPSDWTDTEAVLVGTGRIAAPSTLSGQLAGRLPALG